MTPEQEREVVLGLINQNRKTKLKMDEAWYISNEVMNQIYWRWETDKQLYEQDIGKKHIFHIGETVGDCFEGNVGKKLVQVVKNPYLEKDYPYVVENGCAILLKNMDIDEY